MQVAPRQAISTADRPLPGPPSSKEGILQEALPLPALVSPALAAANEDQAYLRWKAVIHCLLGTAATAVHAPDYTAARWFCTQMMHRDGSRNHASSTGEPFCQPLLLIPDLNQMHAAVARHATTILTFT